MSAHPPVILCCDIPDIKKNITKSIVCSDKECKKRVICQFKPVECKVHRNSKTPDRGYAWITKDEADLVNLAREDDDIEELIDEIRALRHERKVRAEEEALRALEDAEEAERAERDCFLSGSLKRMSLSRDTSGESNASEVRVAPAECGYSSTASSSDAEMKYLQKVKRPRRRASQKITVNEMGVEEYNDDYSGDEI